MLCTLGHTLAAIAGLDGTVIRDLKAGFSVTNSAVVGL